MAWIFYWSIFAVSQLTTTYQYLTVGTTENTFTSAITENSEQEITIDSNHYSSEEHSSNIKENPGHSARKDIVSMMNSGIQLKQKLGLKEKI